MRGMLPLVVVRAVELLRTGQCKTWEGAMARAQREQEEGKSDDKR